MGEAILLGFVQGLTEFLPISSSAHLRIVGDLISADPGAAFTAITQLGTETAVLLYFRRDIARILTRLVVRPARWVRDVVARAGRDAGGRAGRPRRAHGLVHRARLAADRRARAAVPGRDRETFRNLWLIALTLAVFGLVLGWADKVGAKRRALEEMTGRNALQFGFWQALALVPGVSRSGGTITGGLLMGYTREAAARYSFLLAIPAVFGSGLFQLAKSLGDFGTPGTPGFFPTLVATLVAFVVGYMVIIVFLKIVSTFSYRPFVYYRLGLAALVVVFLLTGVLEPTGSA